MGKAFAAGDIHEAQRRAMQLSHTNIKYKKANHAYERNQDKHLLPAVGILKKGIYIEDKYIIYKIASSVMANQIMCLKAAVLWHR